MSFEDKSHFFGFTVQELQHLMESRGKKAVKVILCLGGISEICKKLNTSPIEGLTGNEADLKLRREVFSSNIIPMKPSKTIWQFFWESLQDTTLIILQISALISVGLSFYSPGNFEDSKGTEKKYFKIQLETEELRIGWIQGLSISLSVIVVVIVTSFNNYSKEQQYRSLRNRIKNENQFFVIRNGESASIPVCDIVVGDVCCINYGNLIPVDGITIQSHDLRIDESSLTGEVHPVIKGLLSDPMVYSGTQVLEGMGRIVVTAVGVNSQAGIIYSHLKVNIFRDIISNYERKIRSSHERNLAKSSATLYYTESIIKRHRDSISESVGHKSILQKKLRRLALQIGYVGSGIALLTVIILSASFSFKKFVIEQESWDNEYIDDYLSHLIIGINVLVVVIPEGLPLAVTMSLAYSVKMMMKDNNLVRHLDACEVMGNATAICSDKTGTLTTKRMTVVQSYICETMRFVTPKFSSIPANVGNLLVLGICINTFYTSQIIPAREPGELPKQIGDKTECALLGFVQALGKNYNEIRGYYPESLFVHVYTFNSVRKSMSTVVRYRVNGFRLYTKGAPEIILNKCAFIYDHKGHIVRLTVSMKRKIFRRVILPMASDGLRILLLAHKDFVRGMTKINETNFLLAEELPWDDEDFIVNDLTAISIVGIEDPVRPEVPNAIKMCNEAGITVRMMTGDNIETARCVALKCGIIKENDNSVLIEGDKFNREIRNSVDKIHQKRIDELLPNLRVLARSSPVDKYNLVRGLIESRLNKTRQVVAVIGDGTNDGPALKKADVGFSMGIVGTDIAKEASDIILTDDNFCSIIRAILWGRNVNDNISKFLQFQFTVNVVAVIIVFVSAVTINESPMKSVQMLWVNLIMDTFASLALSTEHPSEELLFRKPYGRSKHLISRVMMKNIIGHAVHQLFVIFLLLFYGDYFFDVPSGSGLDDSEICGSVHFTMVFNVFVFMTLFNEMNSRKINSEREVFKGILRNYVFLTVWIGAALCQIIIVQFGDETLCTVGLDLEQWLWCLFMGVGSLLWNQVIIFVPDDFIFCISEQAPVKERHSSERVIPLWTLNQPDRFELFQSRKSTVSDLTRSSSEVIDLTRD